jgi:YidC/Oxa1 family membrane protein insertase
MEKRQIAFIVISILFLIFWDYFFVRRHPVNNVSTPKFSNNTSNKQEKNISTNPVPSSLTMPETYTLKTLDTQIYHAVISQENGFFKRLDLKRYKKTLNSDIPIDVFREGKIDCFDVIEENGKEMRVIYRSSEVKEFDNQIIINFYGNVNDVEVLKTIQLSKDSYGGNIKYILKSQMERAIKLKTVMQLSGTVFDSSVEANPQPAFFYNTTFEMPSEKNLKKGYVRENLLYAGYAEKYFGIFLLDDTKKSKAEGYIHNGRTTVKTILSEASLRAGLILEKEIKFYAGPKYEEELTKINRKLVASIDYGWFHFISKPLLMIMNFFNKFTNNYGVSIILLTILIKLVFFPLSHKSYKSMKELQKLQPKMEELRKKFAKDREALNREMMLLYRRHGVNPLSGCLPILIQIPFFIALYQALMHAIELRHAPFFGWIKDLSSYDPFYITPILMGITMLIQQIMTPSTGDPTQKKVMYILPVVFTFMFLKFPSGLVLYWLVNNIFSILQQMYTLKTQKT